MRHLIIFIYLISFHAISQESKQSFTAFGVNPAKPHDSLIVNLKSASNFTEKSKAQEDLIWYHKQSGNIDSIIIYGNLMYNDALSETITNKNTYLATACHHISEGKLSKGLFDSALDWSIKGLDYAKKAKNDKLFIKNQIAMAVSKFSRGNTKEAEQLIKKCIENAPNQKLKHDALFYQAIMLFEAEKYDEAEKYFNECIVFYQVEKHRKQELLSVLNLAYVFEKQGKEEETYALLDKIFSTSIKEKFYDLYILTGTKLGETYLELGNYEAAEMSLSMMHMNTMQWENLKGEKRILTILASLYNKKGDFKNAYAIMTQLRHVEAKIIKGQNKAQVNELEIKYETLKKEQEIEKQRTQKNNILIGFIAVLVPLLGLFYVYYQKLQTQNKLNKTLEEVNKQKVASLLKDQELQLIKASVEGEERERKRIAQELHDSIGGNLATIKLQLSSEKQKNIVQQLDDTYNLVRDLSHNLMPKKFKNEAFTVLITDYINNVKLSSNENISLHIHPEEEINQLDETLKVELYKIIQELLTNALKHAKAEEINIHITKFENELKLLFEDNGVGFETFKLKEGIGFQNIKERLHAVNGKMNIDSYPNRGTIIDIDVSLA